LEISMFHCFCGHQHLTFFGTYGAGAPHKRFARVCPTCGCEEYHEKLHDVCVPLTGCSLGPGETVGLDGSGVPVDEEPVHPGPVLEAVQVDPSNSSIIGVCRCIHVHISEACGECGVPPCLHYVGADLDLNLQPQPERKPLGVL
jgi:hypothetical protein